MSYQAVFKRWEIKYMLTLAQKERLLQAMEPYMCLDQYGKTTIRNIYLDTDSYRMIRRSLEKPVYKEKLRIRSYGQAEEDSPVFVELKKKYRGVVYKRRLSMPEQQAMDWLAGGMPPPCEGQIAREIEYLRSFYETLHPTVYLAYDLEAYYSRDGSSFRVTFDQNIRFRTDRLSLTQDADGIGLLEADQVLMELKTPGAIPLWMTELLTRERLFKVSFSKYGNAYMRFIRSDSKGDFLYA